MLPSLVAQQGNLPSCACTAADWLLMVWGPLLCAQVSDPRIQAVGVTTGQLNAKLQAVSTSFAAGSIDGNAALSQIAQVLKVAQGQVGYTNPMSTLQ